MTDLRADPIKNRAFEKLFEAIQECVGAGITANEIREEVAECWHQANLDKAKDGAKEIRGK
jgi:hypothetical protein